MLLTSGQISMTISSCVGKSPVERSRNIANHPQSVSIHILAIPFWLYSTTADSPEYTSRHQTTTTYSETLRRRMAGYREVLWRPWRTPVLR